MRRCAVELKQNIITNVSFHGAAWLCVTRWFTYEAQLKYEAEYAHGMKYLPIGAILKPTMAEARSNVQATT